MAKVDRLFAIYKSYAPYKKERDLVAELFGSVARSFENDYSNLQLEKWVASLLYDGLVREDWLWDKIRAMKTNARPSDLIVIYSQRSGARTHIERTTKDVEMVKKEFLHRNVHNINLLYVLDMDNNIVERWYNGLKNSND